jgi:hypothetical protein
VFAKPVMICAARPLAGLVVRVSQLQHKLCADMNPATETNATIISQRFF